MYSLTSHRTQDWTQEQVHDRRPVHVGDFQKQKQSHWEPRAQKASVSGITRKH